MIFILLSAFYFFYFIGTGISVIFFPKVLSDVGYSVYEIGLLLSFIPLMRFITPFFFLKHFTLNNTTFKFSLFIIVIVSGSFYITLENFYLLLISLLFLGVALSFILPFMEVIALNELGSQKYGKSRLFGSIGFIVIALILGEFFKNPYNALGYFLATNFFTAIVAILVLRYCKKEDELKSAQNEKFSLVKNYAFWIAIFLMQVSFAPFYNFFTIYEISHGLSLQTISFLWIFGVICEVVMLFYQAKFLKHNLLLVIQFCFFATILRWLLLFFFPENLAMLYLSQGLHAFSFALFHSAVIIYLFSLYENKKLAQQFMYGIAYGLGGFFGSLIAGAFYGEYLYLYASFITFLALIAISFQNKIDVNNNLK